MSEAIHFDPASLAVFKILSTSDCSKYWAS